MKYNKKNKLKIATVFSGIGAAEQALKQLNIPHKIVFACDNGERYLNESVDDINKLIQSKPKSKKEQISPCQSFSTYGHRKGLEDTRGTLFYDYARLVKEMQPKAFIFENVTGLLNHDGGNTWAIIQDTFDSLNYDIKMKILNAADYNLPQLRRRVFVVGINRNLKCPEYEFPEPVPLTHKSSEYLDDDVPNEYYLGEKGFNFVTKVERSARRARVNQDIIGCQTANQQFNWVGDFRVETPKECHMKDDRIYKGIYNGKLSVARKMTPRELLRLMGFEDFNIVVKDTVMWRQTGNSIAVPVIKAVISKIIETLDKAEVDKHE